jgi:hypothetical protein
MTTRAKKSKEATSIRVETPLWNTQEYEKPKAE